MRFSGFSFRLGKRTRLYFSNPKTPASKTTPAPAVEKVPTPAADNARRRSIFLVAGACAVVCAIVEATTGTWAGLIMAVCVAGISFLMASKARDAAARSEEPTPKAPPAAGPQTPAEAWQEELDDMAKAEKLQAQLDAEAAARAPKYKTVPILLELDMSPEHQQALRDLKLKIATRGLRGNLTLQQDDNLITVLANDFVLGKVSTADALWIDRCFTYIDKLTSFEIMGGGRDIHGAAIPFMVIVDLSIRSTAPGVPDNRSFDLPSAEWVWGTRPDAVCYISRTGTAHHQLGNCNIGADWTPMFVYEAAEQGYTPCSKCFH